MLAVNHQSWLDPFILAHLPVNFRAAFKQELLLYPGAALSLLLLLLCSGVSVLGRGFCHVWYVWRRLAYVLLGVMGQE